MQITALATATGPHLFWLVSRAAGIAALILSSVGVCVGLLMSGRACGRAGARSCASPTRRCRSPPSAALAVHGLTLLGDGFLQPSLADIAVPFVSGYHTFWTSAGIVAFWALALLGLSYYMRARIGVQRWRRLHRLAALAWVLGLAHSLGEGTDAGQTWFLVMVAIATLPALLALAAIWARRLDRRRQGRRHRTDARTAPLDPQRSNHEHRRPLNPHRRTAAGSARASWRRPSARRWRAGRRGSASGSRPRPRRSSSPRSSSSTSSSPPATTPALVASAQRRAAASSGSSSTAESDGIRHGHRRAANRVLDRRIVRESSSESLRRIELVGERSRIEPESSGVLRTQHLPVVSRETILRFDCFGGALRRVRRRRRPSETAAQAAERARAALLRWHGAFSRFSAASELSTSERRPARAGPGERR